jgi:hypothetical protein
MCPSIGSGLWQVKLPAGSLLPRRSAPYPFHPFPYKLLPLLVRTAGGSDIAVEIVVGREGAALILEQIRWKDYGD